jgi:hypothetical protein
MEKFFLNSKTIQWVILLFIAFAKVFFDVEITAVEIEPIITGVVWLVWAILALYWRFNVKDPVTFSLPSNEIYGWAIDWVKETDRIMWETATVQDLPLLKQWTVHKYNQNKVWSNSCTLVTAVTAWTYTTWVVRSYENLQEAYRRACKAPNPLDPKIGRSLHLAVDLIRKLWKEFYWVDTNTMALSIDNDLEAVQKKNDIWYLADSDEINRIIMIKMMME